MRPLTCECFCVFNTFTLFPYKYGPQTTTETADGSARSLRGCFQWFAEHFKRDNISRSGDTVQVYMKNESNVLRC